MRIETTKKLFTVDEYYRMADAGIFAPEDRVELIEGEIIKMSPIGLRHAAAVTRATDFFTFMFRGKAVVQIQSPVRLDVHNEPVPDVALLKYRTDYYVSRHRSPGDVLLLVEVSDTTLRYDLNVKLPIYAKCGIPEVWIEDLQGDVILAFREPSGKRYRTQRTFQRGEEISPIAFPDISLKIAELLG